MKGDLRIGKVSCIKYEKGLLDIVYEDRDGEVVADVPFLCNGEYRMPNIGELVAVMQVSNGQMIALGTFYHEKNLPKESKKGYRKDFVKGEDAYFRYDSSKKNLTIKADTVTILTKNESRTF